MSELSTKVAEFNDTMGLTQFGRVHQINHKERIALGQYARRLLAMKRHLAELCAKNVRPYHAVGMTPLGRIALLVEELYELCDAMSTNNEVATLDALADLTYVAYGTAYTFSLPLDAALDEVHRSNMTKEPSRWKPIKGDAYSPPDLRRVMTDQEG